MASNSSPNKTAALNARYVAISLKHKQCTDNLEKKRVELQRVTELVKNLESEQKELERDRKKVLLQIQDERDLAKLKKAHAVDEVSDKDLLQCVDGIDSK